MEQPLTQANPARCNYLGTEVDHKWWKRYRGEGFFMRGNGHVWLEDDALCFTRLMLKSALRIPIHRMSGASIGKWHGGTWFAGRPVVKIEWSNEEGAVLTTGIGVRDLGTAESLVDDLVSQISHRSKNASH